MIYIVYGVSVMLAYYFVRKYLIEDEFIDNTDTVMLIIHFLVVLFPLINSMIAIAGLVSFINWNKILSKLFLLK